MEGATVYLNSKVSCLVTLIFRKKKQLQMLSWFQESYRLKDFGVLSKDWDCVGGVTSITAVCMVKNMWKKTFVQGLLFTSQVHWNVRYWIFSSLVGLRLVAGPIPETALWNFSLPRKITSAFGDFFGIRQVWPTKPWGCATKTEVLWCC